MIKIFNGAARGLTDEQRSVFVQLDVSMRDHLHRFPNSALAVFLCIALHMDEGGWSFPGVERIAALTGYRPATVSAALSRLCQTEIEGRRVLLAVQERNAAGVFVQNRYLLFPSPDEIENYAGTARRPRGVRKQPNSGLPNTVEPNSVEPNSVNRNISIVNLKDNRAKDRAALNPETDGAYYLFNKLTAEYESIGRKAPERFQSLEQKQEFTAIEARWQINTFQSLIDRALRVPILSLNRLIAYLEKIEPYKPAKPGAGSIELSIKSQADRAGVMDEIARKKAAARARIEAAEQPQPEPESEAI